MGQVCEKLKEHGRKVLTEAKKDSRITMIIN